MPYELVIRKLGRLSPAEEYERMETYDMYMIKLITKLHEMRRIARQNLIAAEEKSKEYYDRKINPQNLKIGDNVFLLLRWNNNQVTPSLSKPHELSYRSNRRRRVKEIRKSILEKKKYLRY